MILDQLILTGAAIGSFITALFFLSVLIKRNDIADVAWGTGIFIVALISYYTGNGGDLASLVTVLAGLWGLRLTLRILLRNLKKSEDSRYKKWRDEWGGWFYIRSYLQVYLLQGFLMVVVGYTFIHVNLFGPAGRRSACSVVVVVVYFV